MFFEDIFFIPHTRVFRDFSLGQIYIAHIFLIVAYVFLYSYSEDYGYPHPKPYLPPPPPSIHYYKYSTTTKQPSYLYKLPKYSSLIQMDSYGFAVGDPITVSHNSKKVKFALKGSFLKT